MSDKYESSALPPLATLTSEQKLAMDVARVGFMNACPFFCYYFYSEMVEHPTMAISSAATDGRRIFYNPVYLASLKPSERVFVLAHEVHHVIDRHPARMNHYRSVGKLRDLTWSPQLFNICADFVINRTLVDEDIGSINPEWLFDPTVKSSDLVEDVYERFYKNSSGSSSTHKQHKKGGGRPDKTAQDNGGRFDEVLPPHTDPVTGREDAPGEHEFQEAVARAAAAAKAVGKLPGTFKRMIEDIMHPQVDWREHVRMLIAGKIGNRHETWDRPNRRRLVLNPIIVTPGRRGFGAETVAVAVDTSGSIGPKELSAFFAEIGGILSDVKPKNIVVIWCDAAVKRVDEVSSLAELEHVRIMGGAGGGGTDFCPPFEYLAEHHIRPEAMIYLTDMLGPFPADKPAYPVIWCSTSKGVKAPFGEVVEISV